MLERADRIFPIRKGKWEEEGQTIILLRKKSKYKILRKLWGEVFRIHLDEIGSYTWRLCDGKLSILQIAEKLEEKFGIEDARNRTETFLLSLYRGGFLEFRMVEEK